MLVVTPLVDPLRTMPPLYVVLNVGDATNVPGVVLSTTLNQFDLDKFATGLNVVAVADCSSCNPSHQIVGRVTPSVTNPVSGPSKRHCTYAVFASVIVVENVNLCQKVVTLKTEFGAVI